ncbi:MAG: hypothetical protein NTZ59_12380 [Bacteroidetes bacterium]|jgi:hypothetical protein|nr:hypothetical protein [Bacteroidota bacterium]
MERNFIIVLFIVCTFILLTSGTKEAKNRSITPIGYTGATGVYCNSCHSDYPLNSVGGNIELTGLPSGNYIPGAMYNLSIKIKHNAANRERWGFSMKAVESATNNDIGTLSTTNNEAILNGSELSHYYPQSVTATDSFIYNNLHWTAPNTPNKNVIFYYVGNATNNSSGTDDDYIYAGTSLIALPISLTYFTASLNNNTAVLKWQTEREINSKCFEIERSDDGQFFFAIGKIIVSDDKNGKKDYEFVDDKLNPNSSIYYRLKIVDKDGTSYYSKQQLITAKKSSSIFIEQPYPSIVKKGEFLNVKIKTKKPETIKIAVLNLAGNTLFEKSLKIVNDVSVHKIQIPDNVNNGINFIKLFNEEMSKTYSVIVMKN